jgi:hypothetical protein
LVDRYKHSRETCCFHLYEYFEDGITGLAVALSVQAQDIFRESIVACSTIAMQQSQAGTCIAWQRLINTSTISRLLVGNHPNNRKTVGGSVFYGVHPEVYREDPKPVG